MRFFVFRTRNATLWEHRDRSSVHVDALGARRDHHYANIPPAENDLKTPSVCPPEERHKAIPSLCKKYYHALRLLHTLRPSGCGRRNLCRPPFCWPHPLFHSREDFSTVLTKWDSQIRGIFSSCYSDFHSLRPKFTEDWLRVTDVRQWGLSSLEMCFSRLTFCWRTLPLSSFSGSILRSFSGGRIDSTVVVQNVRLQSRFGSKALLRIQVILMRRQQVDPFRPFLDGFCEFLEEPPGLCLIEFVQL